ncbi:hypothetical protein ANANG_G00200890 [Anguilla anguilla]|uniref:Uncharacterized protein n=1 Tax=Anguilla anguilla TaxID=7936 RepID=A0A9D3LY25_ANGAN|nr:hypothetical protein ANANG_G00200890 [Anguilla anguilla]
MKYIFCQPGAVCIQFPAQSETPHCLHPPLCSMRGHGRGAWGSVIADMFGAPSERHALGNHLRRHRNGPAGRSLMQRRFVKERGRRRRASCACDGHTLLKARPLCRVTAEFAGLASAELRAFFTALDQ